MSALVTRGLLWGAAMFMVAGIVHITSVLVLPYAAPNDAFSRLAATTGVNTLSLLLRPRTGQDTIPFRDPAMMSAICRYDLRAGALRIAAAVGDAAFLAVSFHDRWGAAFYALTNRSDNEGRLELVLLTPDQREKVEASDNEDDPLREIRVTAPNEQGFVQFDVLPRVGGYASARETLSSASCKLESRS